MGTLSEKYALNEANLAERKRYIGLTRDDIRVLARIARWAKSMAGKMIRELYDFQFSFPQTKAFLEQHALEKNMSTAELRRVLEQTQLRYFQQIFDEALAGGKFGIDYFERRLDIGLRHNQINLPPKWYIGTYSRYRQLFKKHLRRRFFFRPWLRQRALDAMEKIFNLDLQAVVDAFLLNLFSSYGVDLNSVKPQSSHHDLSDNFGEFKNIIVNALSSVVITSHEVEYASHEVESAANTMVDLVDEQGINVKQALLTLESISKSAQQSSSLAQQAGKLTMSETTGDCAVQAIDRIKETSDQVTEIITLMDSITFQTKLLSLNAAVEAARAGEEGKGFAVVASEVRNLAERSAEASQEVKELIEISAISVQSGYILIHQLAELIEQIVETSEKQSDGVSGVTSAMRELTDVIQKSTHQGNQLRKTAKLMTQQSQELNKVVEALSLDEFADAFSQSNYAKTYLENLLEEEDDTPQNKSGDQFGFF